MCFLFQEVEASDIWAAHGLPAPLDMLPYLDLGPAGGN
jgi:hypothetical protein